MVLGKKKNYIETRNKIETKERNSKTNRTKGKRKRSKTSLAETNQRKAMF